MLIYCIKNVIKQIQILVDHNSPNWTKKQKAKVNPINKIDNKCFNFAVKVALNHEEIGKDAEIITKIKPFINIYEWEGKIFHQKTMIGKN